MRSLVSFLLFDPKLKGKLEFCCIQAKGVVIRCCQFCYSAILDLLRSLFLFLRFNHMELNGRYENAQSCIFTLLVFDVLN